MWTDNPPSPCLSIYLGSELASHLGLLTSVERVQLFIGCGSDVGRVGIKNAGVRSGDYRCIPHGWGTYRVYLPAHTSMQHFSFCQRTTIPMEEVELRKNMVIFNCPGARP